MHSEMLHGSSRSEGPGTSRRHRSGQETRNSLHLFKEPPSDVRPVVDGSRLQQQPSWLELSCLIKTEARAKTNAIARS